jgi:hypothetical protein
MGVIERLVSEAKNRSTGGGGGGGYSTSTTDTTRTDSPAAAGTTASSTQSSIPVLTRLARSANRTSTRTSSRS